MKSNQIKCTTDWPSLIRCTFKAYRAMVKQAVERRKEAMNNEHLREWQARKLCDQRSQQRDASSRPL